MNKVSIIVPVYNSERTIDKCIVSLLDLDYSNKEILFIDDGSTDNTIEIIKEYLENTKDVKLIEQHHSGPASARNLGIKKSSGDILIFTDSDCVVNPDWIFKLLDKFDGNIGAVGGSLKPVSLDKTSEIFEQYRRDSLYGNKERIVKVLPSCNLAIKREVLEVVSGFDESFKYASSEDYDLCLRINDAGFKILFAPSIEILHFHGQTWRSVFRRAYIHGHEGVKLSKKRNITFLRETIGFFKVFILFFIVLRKYPLALAPFGGIYEVFALCGQFRGMIDYRLRGI